MSNFIRIQSKVNITVTAGLQCDDVTNPDAHIPDRLKVSPTWPKTTCFIQEGVGTYPIEIAEWNSVKALVNDGIITIGEQVEELDPEKIANAETLKANLEQTMPKRSRKSKKTELSLEQIVEEE